MRSSLPTISAEVATSRGVTHHIDHMTDVEMKENLSDKNYGIHLDSFKAIENVVYEKKKWEK